MIRKILSLATVVLLVSSCGNKTGNVKPIKVEFAALIENPANYIDKNIKVEGKVVMVCPHTGKEMFIVGKDQNIMLKIASGENSPKFPAELTGSTISVEGRLEKAKGEVEPAVEATDTTAKKAACCASSEKMAMNCADTVKKSVAMCETEAALAKQSSLADLMMIYNKHELVK